MPTIINDGVRIYYEVEGDGPETVVLQHGFSDSLESWREYGYVDALSPDYRVVLIDARGHGNSDKPHTPESYELRDQIGDVVAVLDAVGADRAHFHGVSMGGRYGFGMACYAPDRLRSLMVGCIAPWAVPSRVEAFIEFLKGGGAGFVPAWEAQGHVSDALKARLVANDAEALIAFQVHRGRHRDDDALANSLLTLSCPYRLIAGDQDTLAPYEDIVRYAERLPDGKLIVLPGINHLETMQRLDLVLPHLRALFTEAT